VGLMIKTKEPQNKENNYRLNILQDEKSRYRKGICTG
jgi:hypothetical protein